MQVMTAKVKQTTLIGAAKVFTVLALPPGGYGFQYTGGIVVPISLLGGSSSILLIYVPAIVDDSKHQELLFGYENMDYFSEPRKGITALAEPFSSTSSTSAIEGHSLPSNLASSSLVIEGPLTGTLLPESASSSSKEPLRMIPDFLYISDKLSAVCVIYFLMI